MAVLLIVSAAGFSACAKKDSGKLEINFTIAGYGEEYAQKLTDAFTEKTGIEVKLTTDDNVSNIFSGKIGAVKTNTTDLFFTLLDSFPLIDANKNKSGYENLFLELDELYEMEVPGKGGKKLKELVRPDLYNANFTYNIDGTDGKTYTVPWSASMEGLIYNKKVLDKYGISQLPRTTDEFEEVCIIIKNHGIATLGKPLAVSERVKGALTSANNAGYWEFVWPTWWAQYEGIETFTQYFAGTVDSSQPGDAPAWQALKQDGKLIAIEELSRFINKSNGYLDPDSVNEDNLQTQVSFLDEKAAFIPSGDWMEVETAGDFVAEGAKLDFRFMKTPVTSRLGDKLNISEAELRSTIDYVDGVTDTAPVFAGKSEVQTSEIISQVSAARGIVSSLLSATNKAAIPAYSNKIDEAYQFLLFYASDEGQKIMAQYSGAQSAFGYKPVEDVLKDYSVFQKSIYDIVSRDNATLLLNDSKYPMVYKAGLKVTSHYSLTNSQRGFEALLYNGSSPLEVYNADWGYYSDRWTTMLASAGYGY